MANADEIAGRYQRRAEKLRSIARGVMDTNVRRQMLAWAADYDHMAELVVRIKSTAGEGTRVAESQVTWPVLVRTPQSAERG